MFTRRERDMRVTIGVRFLFAIAVTVLGGTLPALAQDERVSSRGPGSSLVSIDSSQTLGASVERLVATTQPEQRETKREMHGELVYGGVVFAVIGAAMLASVEQDCGASRTVGSLVPDACEEDVARFQVGWGSLVLGGGLLLAGLIGREVPVTPSIGYTATGGRQVGFQGGVEW